MKYDIICSDCLKVKLGEVVFDDSVPQEEAERRARDMGICEACAAIRQQTSGDEPI